MKNKAKDGGELVWLYEVDYENGDVLLVTAVRTEDELRKIFADKIQDDGYDVAKMTFRRISDRRFSSTQKGKRVKKHIDMLKSWGMPEPVYN